MSLFSGRQSAPGSVKVRGNKGVMRQHRDRLYAEALQRQVSNLNRTLWYQEKHGKSPAPLDEFKRKADR